MSGRRLALNVGYPNSDAEGGPAAAIAILTIVSLYAPQCHYYGRGIAMACTLFAVWCLLTFVCPAFDRMLRHFEGRLFLLILFFLIVLFTYRFRGGDGTCKQFIYGTVASLIAFSIGAYYAACGGKALLRVLRWSVLLLGLAVLPSLPTLYGEPGIARPLATGDETLARYDAAVMESGVGSYPLYTAIAVVWPSWIGLFPGARLSGKLALMAALALTAAAVALSTFTMAAVLLLIGACVSAIAFSLLAHSRYRWLMVGGSIAILLLLPACLGRLYEGAQAAQFVFDKADRLLGGCLKYGLVAGDETGRMEMFVDTCRTFLENPLFGVGFAAGAGSVGGHSSLVDHWAVFGLLGYLPLFALQAYCTHVSIGNWWADRRDWPAFGGVVSWALYWIGSVFNPMTFSVLPAVLIFTGCHVRRCGRIGAPAFPAAVGQSGRLRWQAGVQRT